MSSPPPEFTPVRLEGDDLLERDRLAAIKADIAEHASKAFFSIDEVAQRHGVSPGDIRRLLEGAGTTFIEYALEQRLLLAYRMLTDPNRQHQPIGSIALDAGFSDLRYFKRAFRQKFDATPSDIRALPRGSE